MMRDLRNALSQVRVSDVVGVLGLIALLVGSLFLGAGLG
jgi:hypothetical protein